MSRDKSQIATYLEERVNGQSTTAYLALIPTLLVEDTLAMHEHQSAENTHVETKFMSSMRTMSGTDAETRIADLCACT